MRFPIIIRSVVGHSMLPVLPPGTLVLGLTWFRTIRSGDVVVINHEGKEKIKRVAEVEDDKVFVLGDHNGESRDSRQFGWLDSSEITAKIIWPKTKRVVETPR